MFIEGQVTYMLITYINRGDWIRTSDFLLPKQDPGFSNLLPIKSLLQAE